MSAARIFGTASVLVLLILSMPKAMAQDTLSGQVLEAHTGKGLPFARLELGRDSNFFADMDGNFSIQIQPTDQYITASTPFHRKQRISLAELNPKDSLQIRLDIFLSFAPPGQSDAKALEIIGKAKANEWRNDPLRQAPFRYTSYNKLRVSTGQLSEAKESMDYILHLFMAELPVFGEDHHLLLMESVSERKYRDGLNQKELVTATKISGVEEPNFFTVNSQLQPLSVYGNFISILGSTYVSPLCHNPHKHYNYELLDTAISGLDTIWVIKYGPSGINPYGKLQGLLFINSHHYAVQSMTAGPAAWQQKVDTDFIQESAMMANGRWFPTRLRTELHAQGLTANKIDITVSSTTYITGLEQNVALRRADFDEVILEYGDTALRTAGDTLYWEDNRKVPLTGPDRQTYAFYDSLGPLEDVTNLIGIGESIYTGSIPAGKVDLDLSKIVSYNEYEGLRLGLGAHTNAKVSTDYRYGGYIGYGLKDSGFKFGVDGSVRLMPGKQIFLNGALSHDVQESGATKFPFDRNLFSSEFIRRYRLRIMDKVWEERLGLSWAGLRYLQVSTDLVVSREVPTYGYQYVGHEGNRYDFTEANLGIRLGYGERFVRVVSDRISLGSRYPVLWVKFARGINGLLGSDFSYRRYHVKVEQSLNILGYGKSTLQVTAGTVSGEVPYMRLYNGKGSYRPPSSVIHNSFETMRYNEFLSSRHFSLFYTHSFGRLYFRGTKFSPTLEMMHNFGFGALSHKGDHKILPFKTMEKGYFESGIYFNNLLRVQLSSLKVGLGAGGFLRYGAYANPGGLGENIIFKFSTTFGL